MRFTAILCALLLTVALASAEVEHRRPTLPYQCGPYSCQVGEICKIVAGQCRCVPTQQLVQDVTLTQKVIGTWYDGTTRKNYTQYDVVIQNNMNRNIKNIVIDTDATFKLRQPVSANLWNMVKLSNGDLVLPSVQPSINAHASYTFGFILEGTPATPAHLAVKAIVYE
ncbi:hypothetical protein CYY_004932 [Polysphondylium violaceum]|uniref:Carbohydrate binding domain-containing protein n=1 Tax=Polysphondylium violaceum TaxID=133409 RepID=A0A8J4PTU8_9MYCE|nr:hypothetical protein CYY_004932 [Polysphondylium violaceum]